MSLTLEDSRMQNILILSNTMPHIKIVVIGVGTCCLLVWWYLSVLTANVMCVFWRVVVAGSENRKSLYLWLNINDAEGRSYWEVGVRATEGGMLSCFNLCQCPSVWK